MSKHYPGENLKVGDRLRLHFGPFEATGEVVEIIDAGARIDVNDDAVLVGYPEPVSTAPNGTVLTEGAKQTFLGRAHWAAAELL